MRITKVNIPKEQIDNGLDDIKMDRLGQVVVLAGPNGSGKTRILNSIEGKLKEKPTKDECEKAPDNITYYKGAIGRYKKELDEEQDKDKLPSLKSGLGNNEKYLNENKNYLHWSLIETSDRAEVYSMIHYVPKKLDMKDPNAYSPNDMLDHADSVTSSVGMESLTNGALAQIQHLQNRWRNATHQDRTIPVEEAKIVIEDYRRLKDEYIDNFLGKESNLCRNVNDNATLFGHPIGKVELSNGQKVLLQLCLALYNQKDKLEDAIIVLDEPENHLHPAALIEVIDILKKLLTNGQIWIATHSVPLLAHCDLNSIWYVNDGRVNHSGKNPEQVLQGLLGGEKGVEKINSFTSHSAQFAAANYAFECLYPPTVAMTEAGDTQSNQIRDAINKIVEAKGKVRILDFGAGKGRTLANLAEEMCGEFKDKIDYVAYDSCDSDKDMCRSVIERVYETSEQKYFNDIDQLQSDIGNSCFDIVLMCNVLHEIELTGWLNLFKSGGEISGLLKDDGILLLVEDHVMPTGEKAYNNGFMVFDTPQLRDLFKIHDDEFTFKKTKKGRLKAHIIPKEYLIKIDKASRIKALESMLTMAKRKIKAIREQEAANYKEGQKHAFWVQQLANASLYLSEL